MTTSIETPSVPPAESESESQYRTLRTASCLSLSGKSTITYGVSIGPDSKLFLQLVANTGGGRFNNEPVAYDDIRALLLQQPNGAEISSGTLASLYPGRSTNSKGFLLSVALAERLVRPVPNKEFRYECVNDADWLERIHALAQGPTESGSDPIAKVDRKRLVSKASTRRPQPDPVVY